MNKPSVTLIGGVVAERVDYSLESFLLDFPAGVYTVCRTVQRNKIFDYVDHLNRLVDSIGIKLGVRVPDAESIISRGLRTVVPRALSAAESSFGSKCSEFRMTLLVIDATTIANPTAPNVDFAVHVEALPDLAKPPVAVEIWDSPGRQSPNVKDSAWIRQRKVLKPRITGRVNEVVLNANGDVLEGLSSNFYAVRGGQVYTAPDDVILKGTVRTMIVQLCRKNGIPVVMECPKEAEASTWEAAFITSTSRLVLDLDQIEFFTASGTSKQVVHPQVNHPLVMRISELVRNAVDEVSVNVC
ncbi:class IV aminotransferase [Pelomyxa schiedti]|nr:class IV aminotransferase [Pelomyxa schiedti]